MTSELKKENVKSRLIKYVADLWGYQQSDIDGLDPVIDLLLGACAIEFEKVGNQIQSSHSRTLEQLANLLLPEGLTIPRPAHMIIKAQSVEPSYQLKNTDQFLIEKEILNPANPTKLEKKNIWFSPIIPTKLFDASIEFVGYGNQLLKQKNTHLREPFAKTMKGLSFAENEIWLGIKTSQKTEFLPSFSFFFDWKNNPKKSDYIDLLPLSGWYLNGETLLSHKPGYSDEVEKYLFQVDNDLISERRVLPKIEYKTSLLYRNQFINMRDQQIKVADQMVKNPPRFMQLFEAEALDQMKEPLLWLKLEVSHLIPLEALQEMECDINCFPVINRQLIDNRRPYRVDENLSIIPVNSDDHFLSIEKISGDRDLQLNAVPFYNIHNMDGGTYTVRKNTVGRFEGRNVKQMLRYVLEMLRDENASFSAMGGAIGSSDIIDLEKKLNKIEANLNKKAIDQDVTHYLMIKPGKNTQIYISYWSCSGTAANKIPAFSPLSTKTVDIKSNSVISTTSSSGGRDLPSEQEKIYSFRSSLLSRDRIVTKQDIINACYDELGNSIQKISVEKAYAISSGNTFGVTRIINVLLTLNDPKFNLNEWEKICDDLSKVLTQRSSLFIPICVQVSSETDN
jgi:hypothetical protein